MKLVPHLDSCLEDAMTEQEDIELGRCLYKNIGLQCTWSYEVRPESKGTDFHVCSCEYLFLRDKRFDCRV